MTQPQSMRSRASQRSIHRLPVPAPFMPTRGQRDGYPAVTLALPQLDRYHDRAEKALSETIAAYAQLDRDVDTAQWKCLRSRHGVRMFRARHPKATQQTPLLAVGTVRGRFDDVMEGVYCDSSEEMLLMNAIKCPRLADSAVLYTVQRQTTFEPYAFTGIKCATIKLSVASDRELCYFEKTGMVRHPSGKRMAYHVMQSVDLPEYPLKATHKRVQASLCYLLEELDDNLVGIYMLGEMDPSAMSYFATPAITDVLLAVTNALECARAKKLAEMMAATPSPPSRRCSARRCCDVCRGNSSFFEHLSACAGCDFKHVCKKCRMKEHVLARDTTSSSHLMRADFCRVCIAKMETTSIDLLRAEAAGFSMAGQRKAAQNAAFCEVDEETEDVDIPGSDRSLTAFTLKISVQLQDLSSRSDVRASNLSSMEKVSLSEGEDEDEDAMLDMEDEVGDVVNSISADPRKGSQLMTFDKDVTDISRRSSRSTTSSTSSSYCYDEEELDQHRSSLFARLLQVSNQAEATFHMTREQSRIAHSVWERNRRQTQSSEGSSSSSQ